MLDLTTMLRFNTEISACDWPDAVDCRGRGEREREANTLISGARMVWHREKPSLAIEKSVRNILDFKPSLDKLDPLSSNPLESSPQTETRSNSEIKESRKKIPNMADVLARVKGKLVPTFLRLAKHVPAKAVLVQSFRPEAAVPRQRGNVLEGEKNKYPRGANIVSFL